MTIDWEYTLYNILHFQEKLLTTKKNVLQDLLHFHYYKIHLPRVRGWVKPFGFFRGETVIRVSSRPGERYSFTHSSLERDQKVDKFLFLSSWLDRRGKNVFISFFKFIY